MKNKALFLDRDGIINVDKNYVYKIEDFEFIDGIFEVTKYFEDLGYLLIVITNQAGIGRGYYKEEDFHFLTEWMINEFKKNGVSICKVYYCPYHPEFGIGEYKIDSYLRKPNPGMIISAEKELNLNLKECILLGDKESDIEAGMNAGIEHNVFYSKKNKSSKSNYVITTLIDILQMDIFHTS